MYQVLARKYRPRNFIELVGQNHVSRALTSALERGRLHHAYLFTGTRGVGKTTIARILAKCLNCETGVTSTPCEVCPTCTAVNEGRFIDLIEIDAASRTKVEDTRELLDNVPYAPTQGRYKVYLIDEVHMLSTHSFNALLKTLEEPPEHVKFLFATTDPQKLPITVISRCLQFTLRPLAVDEITAHLTKILNKEEIQAEQDAIWQIAESAQGSLRDALSLTDQAIAYGQGAIQHQDVKEMLGLIDRTIIFDLILAIHQNQQQRVSALLMQFRQQALDVSLVLDQFISTLHELALLQYLPDLSLKYSAEINAKIMQLSGLISAQDLQLYYQVACKGRADLQLAVTQEQGFEMCVLRLLAFRPMQPNEVSVQKASQSATQQVSTQETSVSLTSVQDISVQDVPMPSSPQSTSLENESVVGADQSRSMIHENARSNDGIEEQQAPASSVQRLSEASFDLDDDYNEDADLDHALSQRGKQNEPSSDDYLDDEDDQTMTDSDAGSTQGLESSVMNNEQGVSVEGDLGQSPEFVSSDHKNSDIENSDIASSEIQKTIESEAPELTFFGDEPVSAVPTTKDALNTNDDVFFLNPTVEVTENVDSTPLLETNQPLAESLVAHPVSDSALMPQDILALSPQKLEGEWNVDKWEYWFRHSQLSPAVQELAQQGMMTGEINAASVFHIPQKYETILNQFQHTLENELKSQWSNTRFSVVYQEVIEQTPYAKQAERKVKAHVRANELLAQEDAVKSLMAMFEGEIHNVQLK